MTKVASILLKREGGVTKLENSLKKLVRHWISQFNRIWSYSLKKIKALVWDIIPIAPLAYKWIYFWWEKKHNEVARNKCSRPSSVSSRFLLNFCGLEKGRVWRKSCFQSDWRGTNKPLWPLEGPPITAGHWKCKSVWKFWAISRALEGQLGDQQVGWRSDRSHEVPGRGPLTPVGLRFCDRLAYYCSAAVTMGSLDTGRVFERFTLYCPLLPERIETNAEHRTRDEWKWKGEKIM